MRVFIACLSLWCGPGYLRLSRRDARRLRIFEVDHPATQAWKRQRLAEANIPLPACLAVAAVDFERQTLAEGLAAANFDPPQRSFFAWLGCVPYLTEEAVWLTLRFIADLAGGAHVVFDYGDPPTALSPEIREKHDHRAARVASVGEAWLTYFEADQLRVKLLGVGFCEIEDLGPRQIASHYFPSRANALPERGGHIVRASTM